MQKIKEIIKNEKYFSIIVILIASIFVCGPLMNKDIDMTYDDGIQHICRLIGTYQIQLFLKTSVMDLDIAGIYFIVHLLHIFH